MGNWPQQAPQRTPNVTSRIRLTFHTYFHVTGKGPLLEETECHKFEQLLDETVKQLNKSSMTADLGKYFQTYYAINKEEWAACYCKEAFVNTNMYMEAFQRVLNNVYSA